MQQGRESKRLATEKAVLFKTRVQQLPVLEVSAFQALGSISSCCGAQVSKAGGSTLRLAGPGTQVNCSL